MKESDKILLIYKVLNESETSPEDKVLYQELSKGSTSDRELVDDINKIFKVTGDIEKIRPEIDIEASKESFFKKLEAMESAEGNGVIKGNNNVKPKVRRLYTKSIMSIAAVFLILVAAIFAFDIFTGGKTYTAHDSVSLVELKDGSKVWLEKGSKLVVNKKYDEDFRRTELVGSAYFEVNGNVNKPFIIKVDDNIVEVVGTKFQINSRDRSNFEVLVFSGKVKVTNGNGDLVLLQKDTGTKLNSQKELETFELQKTSATSKSNYLVFNNDSLSKVAEKLSRYFNVKIGFKCKNIEEYKGYTSPGYGGNKIDVYFEMLEKVFDIKVYQQSDDSYIIVCNK